MALYLRDHPASARRWPLDNRNPTVRMTCNCVPDTGDTLQNAGGTLTTYSWDAENRLTIVQFADGTRTTATSAGDGKRRRCEDNTTEQLQNFP